MLDSSAPPISSRLRPEAADRATTQLSLRQAATEAEATHGAPYSLAELWRDLSAGRLDIVDEFCNDQRCYLVVRDSAKQARPLADRDREFLERCVLGESEKVLAIDHGIAISTVAGRLSQVLRRWGVDLGASRVPLMIAIAVHAATGETKLVEGVSAAFEIDGVALRIVSAPRPTLPPLTSAESHVLGLVVEGCSNAQIASIRDTSVRTVANQLAAISFKVGVSRRRCILSHLLRCDAGSGSA